MILREHYFRAWPWFGPKNQATKAWVSPIFRSHGLNLGFWDILDPYTCDSWKSIHQKNLSSNKNRNTTQNATKKHMLKCQLFVNVDWNFQTHLGFFVHNIHVILRFSKLGRRFSIVRLREHHSLKWKSVVSIKGRTKTSETCLRWFLESLLAGNVRHWNEVSHVTSR